MRRSRLSTGAALLGAASLLTAMPFIGQAHAASNPQSGRAFVLSGADGSVLRTLVAPDAVNGALFGQTVAGIGDVDADMIPDVAVGASGAHVGSLKRAGRVYIFSGADGSLLRTIDSPAPQGGARFGFSVTAAGDRDGDGAGDLAVGAPKFKTQGVGRTGEAYLISGGTGALLATLRLPTPQRGARFGISLSSGRDVTGEGDTDILVGAPFENAPNRPNQGRVYLFSAVAACVGDPNVPCPVTTIDDPDPQENALFGESLDTASDTSGDGIAEIVVGADGQDTTPGDFSGRVFLINALDPTNPLAERSSESRQPFANFGFAVAGFSDLDGDGLGDFAGTAPDEDAPDASSGRAYVFGGAAPNPLIAFLNDPNAFQIAFFGGSMADLPDLNSDGMQEVVVGSELQRDPNGVRAGRAYLFEAKNGTLLLTLESPTRDVCARFGWSVADAGDADGDGVSDIVVGAPFHRVTPVVRREDCF